MITWRFLTVLILFIGINVFLAHVIPTRVFDVVYGAEWIAIALLMIVFWKWTAEFIRVNLLSYPFWRYLIPKNLIISRWFVVLFAICVIVFGMLVSNFNLKNGVLNKIEKKITTAADIVNETGKENRIGFDCPDENGILIISPPYANIEKSSKVVFSKALLGQMQYFVDAQEAGHLFYINKDKLIDHCTLTNLGEPIFGVSKNKNPVLLISKKNTSGRPIRIEIEDPL